MGRPASLACVVFDLDGVLVDSRRPIALCMNRALVERGLAPEPEARLHRWIGPPLREAFTTLLRDRQADPELADALVDGYRVHYRSVSLEETRLVPGVAEALRVLGARHPLAVATSKPLEFTGPILERLGLAGLFVHVAGPPLERTHLESKAGTLGCALRALGIRPPAPGAAPPAAMVGDRAVDVAAARAHGLLAVGVTWGIGDAEELRAAGAHRLLDRPEELPGALGVGADPG